MGGNDSKKSHPPRMNFLAHAFLAGPQAADRVGGLMGDFVKGSLPGALPADLAAGVELHRRIDSFADSHVAFRASRQRMSAARRRYAGVLVDMFYDHLLARHWSRFHPQPLKVFTGESYALLRLRAAHLPPRLASFLPSMEGDDWLASYAEVDTIAYALERMSQRIVRTNPLAGAAEELQRDYAAFEADFLAILPDSAAFAAGIRASRSSAN
jgi:acyl carrier protein phosphodiesterase